MFYNKSATMKDPGELPYEKKYFVRADTVAPIDIEVKVFKQDTFTQTQHSYLMADTIGDVFEYRQFYDEEAMALFLQALALVFGKRVLTTGNLTAELLRSGLRVVERRIDLEDPQQLHVLMNSPRALKTWGRLGLQNATNPRTRLLAYCGAILLLAGEQLRDLSAKTWTERRIVGLAASMGSVVIHQNVAPFSHQVALQVYHQVCFYHTARATMVRVLLGTCKDPTLAGAMSAAMLNLLAWTEMNHIRMVQYYIFDRYPEILAMRQLQSSKGVLKAAWEYLGTLNEVERPYAKLLYTPQQTKALQRDGFILVTDAANAVAKNLHASFTNYKGDTIGTLGSSIQKTVKEYLASLDATTK